MEQLIAPQNENTQIRTVYTIDELANHPEFKVFTKSSLRHLIYKSRPRLSASGDTIPSNGLVEAGAIIRIGRKILIDAENFRKWISGHREVI